MLGSDQDGVAAPDRQPERGDGGWGRRPASTLPAGQQDWLRRSGADEGESFMRVHWVAVPKELHAWRVNS
eukprot:COSAG01_NODE_17467_length_1149_cov_1.544762_1_plen_70_part_00